MSELLLIANAGDGTISTLRLHREPEPHLEVLATSGDLPECGTFAVDGARDLVFAAFKGKTDDDAPGIAVLSLDRKTGELTELNRTETEGSMTYLSLAQGASALLGVSYSGGFGSVWPVRDKSLKEPHSTFTYDNLHCIFAAGFDDKQHVYAVSLGEDLIAQFDIDGEGRLTPLEPAVTYAEPGSGARHMTIDGTNAYLMTEFSGEAVRFDVHPSGVLQKAETIEVVNPKAGLQHSELGADPQEAPLIWGSDIHVAGDYIITSERNTSELTVVSRKDEGFLGAVVGYTPTEQVPRGFNVTRDGRFVVAVGEESTHAQLLELSTDGVLTERDRVEIGRGANWVRFVR